jgi:hypothetical protein
MTCREFKHSAATLTLWELSRGQDEPVLHHAQQCASCGGWLQEQRSLAVSLESLQARTAGLQAGPEVERAVLRAFRQGQAAVAERPADRVTTVAVLEGVGERMPFLRPVLAPGSVPLALRLSRFFEVGAYVAVAAAIVVGLLLGARLLQRSNRTVPVQTQNTPHDTGPRLQQPAAAASTHSPDLASAAAGSHLSPDPPGRGHVSHPGATPSLRAQPRAAEESSVDAEPGYVALMFCDPLSCSTGSQVVRMELPHPAGDGSQNSQPQIADVVVGYDGVVRAVRLVN